MSKFFKIISYPFSLIGNTFYKLKIKKFFSSVTIEKIDALTGTEFEDIVMLIFQYAGYKVSKTKATNDYGVDIIAKKHNITLAIQAKLYYGHNVGNAAVQQIHGGLKYYGADLAVAVTNWNYSAQAKVLAETLNVMLINRNNIIEFLLNVSNGKKETFFKNLYKTFNAFIKEV